MSSDFQTIPLPALMKTGTTFDPDLDVSLPDDAKLAWAAAAVAYDTGIPLSITRVDGKYAIGYPGAGMSAVPFLEAWHALSNIRFGAVAALAAAGVSRR